MDMLLLKEIGTPGLIIIVLLYLIWTQRNQDKKIDGMNNNLDDLKKKSFSETPTTKSKNNTRSDLPILKIVWRGLKTGLTQNGMANSNCFNQPMSFLELLDEKENHGGKKEIL